MNLLNGRDVLAVLPTGFGKSLIFQMFVIAQSKLSLHNTRNNDTPTSSSCLVICPLESIIEDQIVKSRSLGISASSLTDLTPNELSNNLPQIMFASAEKVSSSAERPKLDSSHLYLAYSCRRIPYCWELITVVIYLSLISGYFLLVAFRTAK